MEKNMEKDYFMILERNIKLVLINKYRVCGKMIK